jgi:hypothetical protein
MAPRRRARTVSVVRLHHLISLCHDPFDATDECDQSLPVLTNYHRHRSFDFIGPGGSLDVSGQEKDRGDLLLRSLAARWSVGRMIPECRFTGSICKCHPSRPACLLMYWSLSGHWRLAKDAGRAR